MILFVILRCFLFLKTFALFSKYFKIFFTFSIPDHQIKEPFSFLLYIFFFNFRLRCQTWLLHAIFINFSTFWNWKYFSPNFSLCLRCIAERRLFSSSKLLLKEGQKTYLTSLANIRNFSSHCYNYCNFLLRLWIEKHLLKFRAINWLDLVTLFPSRQYIQFHFLFLIFMFIYILIFVYSGASSRDRGITRGKKYKWCKVSFGGIVLFVQVKS